PAVSDARHVRHSVRAVPLGRPLLLAPSLVTSIGVPGGSGDPPAGQGGVSEPPPQSPSSWSPPPFGRLSETSDVAPPGGPPVVPLRHVLRHGWHSHQGGRRPRGGLVGLGAALGLTRRRT